MGSGTGLSSASGLRTVADHPAFRGLGLQRALEEMTSGNAANDSFQSFRESSRTVIAQGSSYSSPQPALPPEGSRRLEMAAIKRGRLSGVQKK